MKKLNMDQDKTVVLSGLDGSNPLGFLASLGALKLVFESEDSARMSWSELNGSWSPSIHNLTNNRDQLIETVCERLSEVDLGPWELDPRLPFDAALLRHAIIDAIGSSSLGDREVIDTLTSFGCESLTDDKGIFKDTLLRMVRAGDSAGNGLLAYAKRIFAETSREDITKALFDRWSYQDQNCSLRWDPIEHKGYALQWTDPQREKTVSVRGANCLALVAWPLLPTVPTSQGAKTVCFTDTQPRSTKYLSWPIWEVSLNIHEVKTLLTLSELKQLEDDQIAFQRGVTAIYNSERRATSKYYRNFTPGQRVL